MKEVSDNSRLGGHGILGRKWGAVTDGYGHKGETFYFLFHFLFFSAFYSSFFFPLFLS